MELEVAGAGVETVEVVDGGNSHAISLEQHSLIVTNPQEILVPTSEVQVHIENQTLDGVAQSFGINANPSIITIPVDPLTHGSLQQQLVGAKRSHPSDDMSGMGDPLTSPSLGDIPRKKSRNYLDSHKTIEKKRRDRINQCLNALKIAVPDCKQYGSKKLDKAEILEMTIDYINRLHQNQASGRSGTGVGGQGNGVDLTLSQREWGNDLTTWVIHNKLLYSGPSALDQFCQALLLHLQTMGSGNALASATSMLLNQSSSSADEDTLLRQQTATAQAALLQQLQQQQTTSPAKLSAGEVVSAAAASGGSSSSSSSGSQTTAGSGLQQAQLTQLQALLLLQQQQQLLNQQQQQDSDAPSQAHMQQLQQLQQLQTLLLQHIANEASSSSTASGSSPSAAAASSTPQDKSAPPPASSASTQALTTTSTVASANAQAALPPTVLSPATTLDTLSLPQTGELGAPTTEETVYTSAVSESLDENLLQVNVSVSQTSEGGASGVTPEITDPSMEQSASGASQMWSAGQALMLAGDSEGEGGESAEGKGQLIVAGQEELLTQQEQ